MSKGQKRTAFDMRNQVRLDSTSIDIATIQAAMDSYNYHIATNTTNAHIIDNIDGLEQALSTKASTTHTHVEADITDLDKYNKSEIDTLLANKQDTLTGFTGSIVVVTGVDFVNQTTTTSTISFNNGVVTGVI